MNDYWPFFLKIYLQLKYVSNNCSYSSVWIFNIFLSSKIPRLFPDWKKLLIYPGFYVFPVPVGILRFTLCSEISKISYHLLTNILPSFTDRTIRSYWLEHTCFLHSLIIFVGIIRSEIKANSFDIIIRFKDRWYYHNNNIHDFLSKRRKNINQSDVSMRQKWSGK